LIIWLNFRNTIRLIIIHHHQNPTEIINGLDHLLSCFVQAILTFTALPWQVDRYEIDMCNQQLWHSWQHLSTGSPEGTE